MPDLVEPNKLQCSVAAIHASGNRLAEDAEYLYDFDRFPTAYSLCILAQEEFAKAFLLQLVIDDSIPWNVELRRALRSHACKQLAALIMDFLQRKDFFLSYPNEDWIKRVGEMPLQVIDAVQLLTNEFVYNRRRSDWWDSGNRPLDPLARKIADGMIDRQKQNGLYVQLAFNGAVASSPLQVSQAACLSELERTKRIQGLIYVKENGSTSALSLEYDHILAVFKVLTGAMSSEDFDRLW